VRRVQTRYEITHHIEGLIDTKPTKREAQSYALCWAESDTGYPDALSRVRVYDSMARRGQTTMWNFHDGSWHGMGLRVY